MSGCGLMDLNETAYQFFEAAISKFVFICIFTAEYFKRIFVIGVATTETRIQL